MDLGLKGVHVLITGASGGIGLETTALYASQGAHVSAHYNSNLAPLTRRFGTTSESIVLNDVQADLTDENAIKEMFDDAESFLGTVKILVINHAIYEAEETFLWDMSLERWNKTITNNLTSTFLVAREFLKRLSLIEEDQKDDVSLILIGSTAGKFGEAGHTDYAVSKSAMMYGLTMSLKNEIVKIAPKGRVNAIAPGWVRTPMAEEALKNPNVVYAALASTPLKKVATPTDIANQIVVLSSNKISGHVTGQVLMVEGGMEGRVLNKPQDLGLKLD